MDRLADFPEAFADCCEKVIKPVLNRFANLALVEGFTCAVVVEGFKGNVPGANATDPDLTNESSTLNRHVTLEIQNGVADLSFVAWNPDVKVVRRRNGEDDEDVGLYPLHGITAQFVENVAAQFLLSLRR